MSPRDAAMVTRINLLGAPSVTHDGVAAPPPRGRKAWALLAYLASDDRPTMRQRLAELLFADADDPMGALRWGLAEVRKLLGRDTLGGDPVDLRLPAEASIDVRLLATGSWTEAIDLPGLGQELLAGLSYASAPGFDAWLASERRHVLGLTTTVLADAARARLTAGAPVVAATYARRLVELAPFDENGHVLLVRCLAAGGDLEAGRAHVTATTSQFLAELGVTPTAALQAAAAAPSIGQPGVRGTASVLAQLETGTSTIAAGATEAGIDALRRAVVGARAADDQALLARALVELGGALVHAARGGDEEGATALHEAAALGENEVDPVIAARAHRELAWVDLLRGRYDAARSRLVDAARLGKEDEGELAWVELTQGAVHSDTGRHAAAAEALTSSADRAGRAGHPRVAAFALAFLGRLHLLRRQLAEARSALARSSELARRDGWLTFAPFPEAFQAEVELVDGDVDGAATAFEHAFALGCQIGDPCWESLAARGLGLVAAARGDVPAGLEWLDDAARRCRRLPDSYLWIEAYALDARCAVAVSAGAGSASRWIDELDDIASRLGMWELAAHASLHRARLGVAGAADAATALCARVDNPALARELAAVSTR